MEKLREIEFRGKRTDSNNEWVYGGYFVGKKGQVYISDGTIGTKVDPETVGNDS